MRVSFIGLLSVLSAYSTLVQAADVEVSVTNLTQGVYFTPLLIAAHSGSSPLFQAGQPASAALRKMAEGGAIDELSAALPTASKAENPAAGLLAPSKTTIGMVTSSTSNSHLSLVAMMLPTNDAFVALNNWQIPTVAGTYYLTLNAYDAGTEANDELRGSGAVGMAGMPVPPPLENVLGRNGTGIPSTVAEGLVHIHRGNLGDLNATGGMSDIRMDIHRWLNPVARVKVVVK